MNLGILLKGYTINDMSLITVFILFNVNTDIFEILLNIDNNDRHVDF